MILAAAVRLLIAPPSGGLVDVDADLHLRRALDVLAHGPRALIGVDPMIAWPDGAEVQWPPGFDLMLAGLGWLCGAPRLARVAGVAIAIGGALTIPVAYAFARSVLSRGGALAAAAATALAPAHIELTRVGRIDHHVVEPLLLWAALALLLRRRPIPAGITLALLFVMSPSALLGGALFGAAALWLARFDARTPAIALAVAALATAAVVWPMGTVRRLSVDVLCAVQPLLMVAGALVCALSRGRAARLALGGAGIVLIGLGVAIGSGTFGFVARHSLIGTIVESRNLFAFGAYPALAPLGALAFLIPFAVPLAWQRRGTDDSRLVMGVTALSLLAVTLVQRRFMHLAALPVAVMLIDAAGCLRWTRLTAVLGAVAALAACAPMVRYLFETPPDNPRVLAVRELALLLRDQPAGGVLCQWPYGHIVTRVGAKPVVASPLLTASTMPAAEAATRALLDDDPARARAWMQARQVRYVIATAIPPGVTARYLSALGDPREAAQVERSALVERLAGGERIAGLKPLAAAHDGRARLYVVE
ncbi:MAG TPA: hypothetical protein VKN99_12540 [Polyangia bacterium]|nr:hypothetical protein [Polyangia bacterium]